jgi:hypothetical protein
MDGEEEEGVKTPYNDQELKLSKYFRKWPSDLELREDGSVFPKVAS